MFSAYFADLEKSLLKKYGPSEKGGIAKKGKVGKGTLEYPELAEALANMVDTSLRVGTVGIVDRSGYSPEMPDFIAYRPLCAGVESIFGGNIPSESARASFHVYSTLDRKTLIESLVHVAQTKKCDRFTEEDQEPGFIGSFIIAFNSSYTLPELKQAVHDIYKEQNVDPEFEVDIIAVLGKGIMVKNWRERRNFVALETEMETLKWFFVLMREYCDIDIEGSVELREYVKEQKQYKEY